MSSVMSEESVQGHINALVSTAAQLDAGQLADLVSVAKSNLESMLNDPDGPFCQDPELAMKAFSTLVKLQQSDLETKRRSMDTVIKMIRLYGEAPALPANMVGGALEPPAAAEPDESTASNLSFGAVSSSGKKSAAV